MKHLGDISRITKEDAVPVDCITFGSPCQDLSIKGFAGVLGGHEVIRETYNIDYMEDMEKYGWNKNSAPFPSMVVAFRTKMEMLEGME